VIRAGSFEHLLKVIWGALCGRLLALALDSGDERVLMPLPALLLFRVVGAAFAGVVFPLCLATRAVEDHPHHLLAEGVASDDVEELFFGLRTLSP
jgi:hypothetical protein